MSQFISGINHIALPVHDLGVARKWFVEFLGFSVCGKRDGELFVRVGSDVIALRQEAEVPYSFDHYGFSCHSPRKLQELHAQLRERNTEFIKDLHARAGGNSMLFRDPFGHICECQSFEETEYERSAKDLAGFQDPSADLVHGDQKWLT